MTPTVRFAKSAANVFFHILTQCNLKCRHCYINPEQHGTRRLGLKTIQSWLATLSQRSPGADLIFLGGEPTLHPELPEAIRSARQLGYRSITIDTNGYLFNDILDRVTPNEVDFISFSLDGASSTTNDPIRGEGSFDACTQGIHKAAEKGFRNSLIYTVSSLNLDELKSVPALLKKLPIERFFIQVIGLRGQSAISPANPAEGLQVTHDQWQKHVLPVARQVAARGLQVTYPKVFLETNEPFECAGQVADNYFIFPNGRVYRCPLCEDFPLHSLSFENDLLIETSPINESHLFKLDIAEGCVMNKLIQPHNISYRQDGSPAYKIACCLLKEEI